MKTQGHIALLGLVLFSLSASSCGVDPAEALRLNRPPAAQFSSTPSADALGNVTGNNPLTFTLNMCGSSDPDRGDEIRYEYYWQGLQDQPNQTGPCRMDHTYKSTSRQCSEAVGCVWDRQPLPDHRVCKTYKVCVEN
jgi:hypothetical protein